MLAMPSSDLFLMPWFAGSAAVLSLRVWASPTIPTRQLWSRIRPYWESNVLCPIGCDCDWEREQLFRWAALWRLFSVCGVWCWQGYYARWSVMRQLLFQFLDAGSPALNGPPPRKQILSLGAGFDTSFFQLVVRGLHCRCRYPTI